MTEMTVQEAQRQLPSLLTRVCAGDEVVISVSGEPVVKMIPVGRPLHDRVPGRDEGLIQIADDFDAPLPEEILNAFEP